MKRNLTTLYKILNESKCLDRMIRIDILNSNIFNDEWLNQFFLDATYESFACFEEDELDSWFEDYEVSTIKDLAKAFCENNKAISWLRRWYGYHDLVVIAEQEEGLDPKKLSQFVKKYRWVVQ